MAKRSRESDSESEILEAKRFEFDERTSHNSEASSLPGVSSRSDTLQLRSQAQAPQQQQLQQPQQTFSFTPQKTLPVTNELDSPQIPVGGLPTSQAVGVGGAAGTLQGGVNAPSQPTVSGGALNTTSGPSTVQTAQASLAGIQPTLPAPGMGMPSANPAAPASSIAAVPTSIQANFSTAPHTGFSASQPKPGFSTAQPGFSTAQPGFSTAQPGFSTAQPGFSTAQPGFSTAQPGLSTAQPGFSTTQPQAFGTAQSGFGAGRPGFNAPVQRPPTQLPAASMGQQPQQMFRPPITTPPPFHQQGQPMMQQGSSLPGVSSRSDTLQPRSQAQPQQQQQQLQQPQQQTFFFTPQITVPVTNGMGLSQIPVGGLPAPQGIGVGGAAGTLQGGVNVNAPGQPTVSGGPLNTASGPSTVQTAQASLAGIQPTLPAPGMGMLSANPAAPASSIAAVPTSIQANFSTAPHPGFSVPRPWFSATQPGFNVAQPSGANPGFSTTLSGLSTTYPVFHTARPGFGAAQSSFGTAQPRFNTARPGFGAAQSGLIGTAQPWLSMARPGFRTAQPGFGTAQSGFSALAQRPPGFPAAQLPAASMGQQPQQMFRPPITTPPPFHQQGQPMMQQQQQQQQPAVKTPQEKQAILEKFLTYLDKATPEQQEQLLSKIRATPEQRQQLLARVQAMRMQRQQQQQSLMQQQQAQGTMQQDITIWNGYMEMVEMRGQQKQTRQIQCSVTTNKSEIIPEIKPELWPTKMSMNAYPKPVFNSIINLMKFTRIQDQVRTVTFNFKENPHNIMMLKILMSNEVPKHFAFVQLVGTGAVPSCPLRVLFLVWDDRKKQFTGLIPLEQEKFLTVIKQVLMERAMQQQQQQQSLIQQQQQLQDGNPDLAKYLAACEEAMRKKGKLNQTIISCVFVGPSGNGKTSLMRRLIGKPPLPSLSSTGVAEKVIQVDIRRSSSTVAKVVQNSSVWTELTLDDEAVSLLSNISESRDQAVESRSNAPGQSSSSAIANTSSTTAANTNTTTVAEATVAPSSFIPPLEMYEDILRTKDWSVSRDCLEGTCIAYLTDTGGQLEFQELLPALVSGPSVFFLVFRLDQDLNERFTIVYRHPSKGCSVQYESSYTVLEFLLHTLASIASMGSYTYEGVQKKQVPLKPKVFFIGTHKDKVSKEKIEEIDRDLLQRIQCTDHYRSGIIQHGSEELLIIPVNNLSPDDSDAQLVRSAVERIKDQGMFDVTAPPQWLIFSQVIRQLKERVLTYEECFVIAKQCGFDTSEELNDALGFLSTKVGLIRYFQGTSVDEDLQKIVIKDPQVLFDRITNLVIETFTFENVDPFDRNEFKKKGIFSRAMFEEISSKEEDKLLTPSTLLKLLQHLHIIAPISELSGDTKYFFPCILAHAAMVDPKPSVARSQMNVPEAPPLLVCFHCGYCPRGLFCFLVVYLLNNQMKSDFPWKLECEEIFRNQISFSVDPYGDRVSLNVSSTLKFIEVNCTSSQVEPRSHDFPTVCSEVRHAIESGVQTVASTLHYMCNPADLLKFSFYCPREHPAEITFYDRDPCSLRCSECQNHHNLPTNYEVWFSKTCDRRSSSAQLSFDSEVEPGSSTQSMPSAPGNDARLEINRILNWLSAPNPGYAQPTALLQQMPRYPYPAYTWPHGPPTLPQYPPHPQSGGWTGPRTGATPFPPSSSVPTHPPASLMMPERPPVGGATPFYHWPFPQPSHVSTAAEPVPLAASISETTPSGSSSGQVSGTSEVQQGARGINTPTLDELLDNVSTTKWFRLGLKLGLTQDELEIIESDRRLDASEALMKVLREWLRQSEKPTWRAVVQAMRAVGEVRKASSLEDKFY